jgi:hypothetical protein
MMARKMLARGSAASASTARAPRTRPVRTARPPRAPLTPLPAPTRTAPEQPPALRLVLRLLLLLLLLLLGTRGAEAQCSGSTYSYGSGACASCAAGASFVSSSAGCTPSATLTPGPANTALYLSGSQAEGVAAFAATGAAPTYAAGPFGGANGALVLASGSYLTAPGASAPSALPSGGNVAWSASAWVKCAAPATWAGVLEWGAMGYTQGVASTQTAALVVAGPAAAGAGWGAGGVVTTLAGGGGNYFADGAGATASFNYPFGVAFMPSSGLVVVADMNHRIRLVNPTSTAVTSLGGSGIGYADGSGTGSFNFPAGVAVIPASGVIVVADRDNHRLRLMNFTSGAVTTLAGSGNAAFVDGTGTAARLNRPQGVCVIPSSGEIIVADTNNNRIRRVIPTSGDVTTLAGSGSQAFADGVGTAASFFYPTGVAVIPSSGQIVVADSYNHRIRLVDPISGAVTTLAGSGIYAFADGTGVAASFNTPTGVAVIPSSGVIVVADFGNHRIRLVNPISGAVTSLAGSGVSACFDGTGATASFSNPSGVAVIPLSGVIVVADQSNHRIRLVTLPPPPALAACDSTWHHVALAYSPSASPYQLSAFLDGALAFQLAATITLPARAASTLSVGWSGDLSFNLGSLFAGSLAELRVYNRTLSAVEVVALSQPTLTAYANAAVVPAVPVLGASSYSFSCAAGSAGPSASQVRGPDGAWSWAAGATPSCTPCAAGSFSGAGLSACAPCYPGTYSLAGASSCSLCPAGTFGDRAGLATDACAGACATCVAGSTTALHAPLTCSAGSARGVPSSLGLQIWPAANAANLRGVDLLVAPLALCRQMTSAAACAAADSVVGGDGATRFVVGTAAAFNVEPAEALTCAI